MISSMGGKKVDMSTGHGKKKKKKYPVGKNIWFDSECKKLKNGLNHLCNVLNKNPVDGKIRQQFYLTKMRYKK